MDIRTFTFPTSIHYGVGARHRVAELLDDWGLIRPLIVTDRGLAQLDLFTDLDDRLRASGAEVGVFADLGQNPRHAEIVEGVRALHSHHADAVVAFGGGAALDAAKSIAILSDYPGSLFELEEGRGGEIAQDRSMPLLIAVPTTAGTGSEVSRTAVISEDRRRAKRVLFSPRLMPTAAVVDPELTLGLPRDVTAQSGVIALLHNLEAYLAEGYNPLCDGIALEGVRLLARSFPRVLADPRDLDARGQMMSAALMGAVAQQKGGGVGAALARAASAALDAPYGAAAAAILPAALRFAASTSAERLARLAEAAERPERSAAGLQTWLEGLLASAGLPGTLSALGASAAQEAMVVELAQQGLERVAGPCPQSPAELSQLLKAAWG